GGGERRGGREVNERLAALARLRRAVDRQRIGDARQGGQRRNRVRAAPADSERDRVSSGVGVSVQDRLPQRAAAAVVGVCDEVGVSRDGGQYHVVARPAGVGDAEVVDADCERRALGQAGKNTGDRISPIVVDDLERIADGRRERVEQRNVQRAVEVDGAVDDQLVEVRGGRVGALHFDIQSAARTL